jgi:dTDP-4-dehydrorhamnose reductase
MPPKLVVVGGGGQLGVEVCRTFETRGWTVKRLDRKALDVTDERAVESAIAGEDPNLVVNAAAYNQVDLAENEPQAAFEANALAVRNLAMACRQSGAKFVHYSTDYVFDGTKGSPYVETDLPHPIGAYAVSKLAGELYARAYLDNPLILRVSGVFGPGGMFTPRGNFVELMLRLAQSGNPIRVVRDYFASPTYAPAAAARTADAIAAGLSGVYHLGGGIAISWYEYARIIFEEAGLSPDLKPTTAQEYRTAARRPPFSSLSNQKIEAAGIAAMPPLGEAVKEYIASRDHVTAHR